MLHRSSTGFSSGLRSGIRSVVETKPEDFPFASGTRSMASVSQGEGVGSEYENVRMSAANTMGSEPRAPPAIHDGLPDLGWAQAALLIVADVVGVGVLAIPGACRKLGWWISVPLILACYPLNLYVGVLMERLRRWCAPGAATLGDLGYAIFGNYGGYFGWLGLYLYIIFVMGDYLIVLGSCLEGLINAEENVPINKVSGCLISAAILLLPNQLRSLSNCLALCISSALTMGLSLILILSTVFANGCPKLTEETGSLDVWQFTRALSAFTFAFAGNTIYLEMMAEMKEPRDFAKSLNVALPCLLVVYMIVGLGTYAKCGEDTPNYLLKSLDKGTVVMRIVSFLLFAHVLTSYIINQQVLCRGLHLFLAPSKAVIKDRQEKGFWMATFQWFVITTGAMIFALVLALSIKTFDDIVTLIGAALATPLCFVFPAVCLLGTARMADLTPKRLELSWNVVLFLAFVAATVLGTIAVIKNMVEKK